MREWLHRIILHICRFTRKCSVSYAQAVLRHENFSMRANSVNEHRQVFKLSFFSYFFQALEVTIFMPNAKFLRNCKLFESVILSNFD